VPNANVLIQTIDNCGPYVNKSRLEYLALSKKRLEYLVNLNCENIF